MNQKSKIALLVQGLISKNYIHLPNIKEALKNRLKYLKIKICQWVGIWNVILALFWQNESVQNEGSAGWNFEFRNVISKEIYFNSFMCCFVASLSIFSGGKNWYKILTHSSRYLLRYEVIGPTGSNEIKTSMGAKTGQTQALSNTRWKHDFLSL